MVSIAAGVSLFVELLFVETTWRKQLGGNNFEGVPAGQRRNGGQTE